MLDYSDVASMYSSTYASAANQTAAKLQNTLDSANYSASSKDELMDACKQFEAYFVEQMFKEMQKTVDVFKDEDSDPNGNLVDFFKDNAIQELAGLQTEREGLGLAQMLYEQMKRNYGISDVPEAAE